MNDTEVPVPLDKRSYIRSEIRSEKRKNYKYTFCLLSLSASVLCTILAD
jgi:hypothetical protein